jgi:two-component system, NtrC family, response regulator AtoC
MNNLSTVYVIDNNRIMRLCIADELRKAGYIVFEFSEPKSAIAHFRIAKPEAIISDMNIPEMSGLDLIDIVKNLYPEIYIVIMTAFATVDNAVNAMRLGAYDYITKPVEPQKILFILERIDALLELRSENKLLKKQININYDFSSFISTPSFSFKIFDLIKLILDKNTTVLIHGETGTGKELITNIIHYNSNRKSKPLVKVSCAILAKEILESELFGHVKGAFTGADKDKPGRFELANKGTLYLDDIDDMPLNLQVKLLRALEEGEIERVGATTTTKVDVRIIASTKTSLKQLVDEGKFRSDLYYRLNVFPIYIPSLRERKNDIRVLVNYFYRHFSAQKTVNIDEDVYEILNKYDFPGNVRELKNLIERMVIISDGKTITSQMIPYEIKSFIQKESNYKPGVQTLPNYLDDLESKAIKSALKHANFNKSKASQLLGIPLSTLRTKMERLNL